MIRTLLFLCSLIFALSPLLADPVELHTGYLPGFTNHLAGIARPPVNPMVGHKKSELTTEEIQALLPESKRVPYFRQEGGTCGLYAAAMVMAKHATASGCLPSPKVMNKDFQGSPFLEPMWDYVDRTHSSSNGTGGMTQWKLEDVVNEYYGSNAAIGRSFFSPLNGGSIPTLEDLRLSTARGEPVMAAVRIFEGAPSTGNGRHWVVVEDIVKKDGVDYVIMTHGFSDGHIAWRADDFDKAWDANYRAAVFISPPKNCERPPKVDLAKTQPMWREVKGAEMSQVAVASDGTVYGIDAHHGNGQIKIWKENKWIPIPGGGEANHIHVSGNQIAITQADGSAYIRNGLENGWEKISDGARDIVLGPNGEIYRLGESLEEEALRKVREGKAVYNKEQTHKDEIDTLWKSLLFGPVIPAIAENRLHLSPYGIKPWENYSHKNGVVRAWDNDTNAWSTKKLSEGVKVAVAPDRTRWQLDQDNGIWMINGDTWVKNEKGLARDIAIGKDSAGKTQVWVIGTTPREGGYGIYYWTGSDWLEVGGGAVSIAVGPDGLPWVTTDSGQVYHLSLEKRLLQNKTPRSQSTTK